MNPLLTVVVPVYNGEKYVCRAVQSVLSQPEAKLIEVLLIDDGSRDGSGTLCDCLVEDYENVRVIHKENGGVSSARNLGIEEARGKYVAFLDCDDWWEPRLFDRTLAEELSSDVSADVYQFSYREVNCTCTLEKRYICEEGSTIYDGAGFGRYDWSPHCSFVFLRKLLIDKDIRYLRCKVGEDGPMVELALYQAQSLKRYSRMLFSYWENPLSCVHTTKELDSLKEQCKGIAQKKQYCRKHNIPFDEETATVWQILSALPKICAFEPFSVVRMFMEEQCMCILDQRPDIHFGKRLWNRLEAWRSNPYRYWLTQKVKVGVPMGVKKLLFRTPGLQKYANYVYTRYYRGFTPIASEAE